MAQVKVKFHNKTADVLDWFWVKNATEAKKYGTIQPNASANITTYVGHKWSFRDSTGKERFSYVGAAGDTAVTLEDSKSGSAIKGEHVEAPVYKPDAATQRAFPPLLSADEELALGKGDLLCSYRKDPLPLLLEKLRRADQKGKTAQFTDSQFPPVPASLTPAEHVKSGEEASFRRLGELAPKFYQSSAAGSVQGASQGESTSGGSAFLERLGVTAPKWMTIPGASASQGESAACSLFGDEGPRPHDVRQGYVGNCWLHQVTMAATTCPPETLASAFGDAALDLEQECIERGVFVVRFKGAKGDNYVVIDDFVPVSKARPDDCLLAPPLQGKLWVPLLEKAVAKVQGGYGNLRAGSQGGMGVLGFKTSLLGGKPVHVSWDKDSPDATWSQSNLWERIKAGLKNPKTAISLSSADCGKNGDVSPTGIVHFHGYVLLEAHEINPSDGTDVKPGDPKALKLVKVRNTWRTGGWNGDWSPKSKLWDQYPAVKKRLTRPGWDDDATFVMTLDDFKKNFKIVWLNE